MFPLLWQYKDEVKTMAQAFFGGVHPNDMKAATNEKAIEQLEAPAEVVIPMSMHIGAPCKPIVAVGDKVTIGQKIGEPGGFVSAPIHASVSGTVKAVEPRPFSMGGTMMSVVIENDFQNTVCPDIHPVEDPDSLTPEQLVEIVKNAGIVGQGGATFPTHVKISSGLGKVDYVIINAAECEPYITGDHRAMLERPAEIIGGCCYLAKMFGVSKGDTYDKKSMHKRLGIGKETDPEAMSVSSLYQNNGYLMSQIEPAETIIAPDSIDIEVKVFEGKQFTINEVGITGNQRVDDEVIRRELDTRPGELYNRALLMRTIRYRDDKAAGKNPPLDVKLEAMLPVVNREIPIKCHAHRADDILTAVRIAREFDLKLTLDHCTDGEIIADELAEEGYPVFVGPSLGGKSKVELRNKSFTTAGVLYRAGLTVSIITDAPVIPLQHLPLAAGLAAAAGLPMEEAWRAITINPAQSLGISDRVGSLEPGKDADLVLWTADPLTTIGGEAYMTIVNGEIVYQAER